jgi:hypothetical protein
MYRHTVNPPIEFNAVQQIGVPAPAGTSVVATNNATIHLADNGMANAILAVGRGEAFVFSPNFGQAAIANFALEMDTIQFSKANFADINALLALLTTTATAMP